MGKVLPSKAIADYRQCALEDCLESRIPRASQLEFDAWLAWPIRERPRDENPNFVASEEFLDTEHDRITFLR